MVEFKELVMGFLSFSKLLLNFVWAYRQDLMILVAIMPYIKKLTSKIKKAFKKVGKKPRVQIYFIRY